jgi:hypothetical protein
MTGTVEGEGPMRTGEMVRFAVVALCSAMLAACSDVMISSAPPPPPPPPPAAVLLKDILIPNLPSPYYHFEYDSAGRVAVVSFASGLTNYDVTYRDGRIVQMQNNIIVNHDRLVYIYDDSARVAAVRYVDTAGVTFTLVTFTYDGQKLTGLERDRRVVGGFIIDKTMSMTYDADGNLRDLTEHRPAIAGLQDDETSVVHFEQYDSGTNVDGFGLIHDDFFDHLVLLPRVQLQQGNPQRETRTGDGLNYVVDYTYTYDAQNRPLAKTGALTITNGTDAGRQFQTSSVFTYY